MAIFLIAQMTPGPYPVRAMLQDTVIRVSDIKGLRNITVPPKVASPKAEVQITLIDGTTWRLFGDSRSVLDCMLSDASVADYTAWTGRGETDAPR